MTPQQELQLIRALDDGNLSPVDELKIVRALESGDAQSVLGKSQSSLGMERAKSFEEILAESSKRDENFDYTTGAKGGLRTKLSFMETDEEKENLLQSIVGVEGYTKDRGGNLALTPKGQSKLGYDVIDKNLVIEEEGFRLGRDLADVAGLAPETIGSVIGGILGAPGLVTGALGAGAGAAVGQTVEEGIEGLLGLQKQTAGEVATDVAKEAAIAGAIDFATVGTFKALRGAVNMAGKGASAAARATGQAEVELGQEGAERALRLLDEGALPSYEAAGMPAALSRMSQIAEAIGGKEKRAVKNVMFAIDKKKKLLDEYGAANVDELSSIIGRSAPAKADELSNALKNAQKAHMNAIDESVSLLTQSTRKGGEIDDFVLKTLTDNYENFIKGADGEWKAIDETLSQVRGTVKINGEMVEATGGELPIFDIGAFKTRFDDVINTEYGGAKGLPPEEFTEVGGLIGQLTNLGPKKGFTSFNGMKNLRKKIQDTLMDPRLGTGDTTARRLLSDVRDRIDNMMYGKTDITFTGVGRGNAPKIKQAMKQLENARASYNKEIGLYRSLERLNILRNVGEAGKDVKLVVGRYFDDIIKTPDRINAVLDAAKGQRKEVRQALAQRYIDDALFAANKDFSDPNKFNGVLFNSKIKSLGKSGKAIFGDDWGEVQNLARSLSYGGMKRIDDDILERVIAQNPSDNIVTTLKSIKDAQVGLDEAMSTKVLRDLTEGKLDPEEAATVISSPKTTRSQMNRIMKFFENDVKSQDTIRRTIVNDILGSVDEEIFVNEKAASSLKNAINSYQPKMLEKVLGKQTLTDMNQLADDLIFLRDTGRRGAGSLAADAIRTGVITAPIKNASKLARFKVLDYMFNNPSTMRRALELKTGRTTPEAAAQSWSQAINEATEQVTGEGASLTERAAGVGQGVGRTLGAINRGQTASRQALGQLLTSPQGTQIDVPQINEIPIPEVQQPISIDDISIQRTVDPTAANRQANLRQRAKENPAVAATLLGGLGSAGLL